MSDTPLPTSQRVVRLREFESVEIDAEELLLDGEVNAYDQHIGKDYFELRLRKKRLFVAARGFVGFIPINERLAIEVVPRVPIGNLPLIMEVSGQTHEELVGVLRDYAQHGTIYPPLISIYVRALKNEIERVASQGLLKEYEWREATTSFPHGRILAGRTIQQVAPRGEKHKLVIGWHQRTIDSAANRCLKYAVHWLHAFSVRAREALDDTSRRTIAGQLNYCDHLLDGVMVDHRRKFLADDYVSGARPLPPVRSYYRSSLDVARLIIGDRAVQIEGHGDEVQLPSLLVDMGRVFESYMRNVLVKRAEIEAWNVLVLDGNKLRPHGGGKPSILDRGATVKATPDVVIQGGSADETEFPVIIDMKYKPASTAVERADLNQLLGYGVSYRTRHLVIAQPRGSGSGVMTGLREYGSVAGMTIWRYVFDLEASDLAGQERQWSAAIQRLL